MKLFKSKKKDGEKKSKSSLFGSRKKSGSKNLAITKSKLSSMDADSSSFTSQTDTATTMSPRWLNGNATSVNSRSNALAYHEQIVGGGDRTSTESISSGTYLSSNTKTNEKTRNPFDESDAYNVHRSASASASSGSEGSDVGEVESSVDFLENILAQVEEKERKEWADMLDDSQEADNSVQNEDLDGMLRKTVDRMDVEPLDVEVQRLGTQIVYHLSKLRRKTKKSPKQIPEQKAADSWFADSWFSTEKSTPEKGDSDVDDDNDDDDAEELITDALDAILQAMEDFPDDEDLIESACLAIEDTSGKRKITNSAKRILEEVLMAIEGFADNPAVVSACLGVLCNLSSSSKKKNSKANNDELRRRLAKYALPSILHAMKEHRDDIELYTKGCKAIDNFTKDDQNAQRILACKESLGLRIVSEGMKYWKVEKVDEFSVLQQLHLRLAALRVLKNLSTHLSLEVKGKIVLGGGAARIVDRLLEALVVSGKDLIDNAYEAECNTIQGQIDEEDHVGICLTIMRDALETIANLADIESVVTKNDPRSPHMPTIHRSSAIDNSSAEDIQRQLTKAVKPVLNTIRQHPNRRSLQYHGLNCARRLTVSHADSIANHGGISTFLNLLSSSGLAAVNDSMIHERALSCLTGLLSPSSNTDGLDLVASMETEDGLDAIFRIIRRYQTDTAVIETAYESLFYLSCRVRVVLASIEGRHHSITRGVGAQAARKLQIQLCLEENIFVMLGTLNQHFEASESIGQRGLGLLVNVHAFLTKQQEQRHQQHDIIASDGGIRLVLAVMRRHGLAVAIQEYGVGLLAEVLKSATNHDAIRREFVDEEGINSVVAAMMIHPDHAAVQCHACDLLMELMDIDKHPMENGYSETAGYAAFYKKRIVEDTDAVSVVQDSLVRFKSHKGVQHFGSALLQELSTATAITPLSAMPSEAVSISTKLQSSILSGTSRIAESIRSSLE
jgi:hypothetical protein